MAILKMDKIKILGLLRDKADILESLQESGNVELIDPENDRFATDDAKTPGSLQADNLTAASPNKRNDKVAMQESNQTIQTKRHQVENSLAFLEAEFPDVVMDKTALNIDVEDFRLPQKREQKILKQSQLIQQLNNEINALTAENNSLLREQSLLKNWLDLDVNLAISDTNKTHYFLGSVENDHYQNLQEVIEQSETKTVLLTLKELESSKIVAVVTLKQDQFEIDHILKQSGFIAFPITKTGTPKEIYNSNQKNIDLNSEKIQSAKDKLKEIAKEKIDFYILLDYFTAQLDKNEAQGLSENTEQTFYLEGYLPQKKSAAVKDFLTKTFPLYCEIEELPEDSEYPILLKNRPFANAYQTILEMFGAPNTNEIDPTPGLAPFTFIFFGMMLSDVGYGLLLTLGCAFLLFKKKIDVNTESGSLVRMLFLSGISATIWGFVFGGFFGDLLTVLSDGKINFPVLWFNPMDDPQKLMIWSMIFGIIHLYAGMAMKIINEVKFGKVSNIIFDVVPWYILITGLGLLLGGSSLGVKAIDITAVGKWMAIVGAAIIFLFAGREKKNIFARILSGVGGLYGTINFLGDILSYTRILALVLATSVIATVVNFLCGMVMGGLVGTIGGILILLGGHLLNLALSALSAYVHSSRLQYVEFFGRFFEGGGNFFKPLKYNTKYVKIQNKKNYI